MENTTNQFECRDVKAGEILFNATFQDNILLFVGEGTLLLRNKTQATLIEINEGHFVLLPAEIHHIATAITSVRTLFIYAGPLSDMIVNDAEWNPEHPIVLPIHPSLAHTLGRIKYFHLENWQSLN